MAKRKNILTEQKIEKMEKEGRGQGRGEEYKPWIVIQDFPSQGLVTRGKGWKTNRIHHFLSKLERSYFYVLEWSDSVVDIREQFPLNRADTLEIAANKNIKHPEDPTSKIPIVMTSDFLITIKDEHGKREIVRTIKPSKELENKRVIEKFEIERSYWEERGIDWGIVTEKEIPENTIENVEWLHLSYYGLQEIPTFNKYVQQLKKFIQNDDNTIIDMVTEFDTIYHLDNGTGLEILKYLITHKMVKVNINEKIYTHQWIKDVIDFDVI